MPTPGEIAEQAVRDVARELLSGLDPARGLLTHGERSSVISIHGLLSPSEQFNSILHLVEHTINHRIRVVVYDEFQKWLKERLNSTK